MSQDLTGVASRVTAVEEEEPPPRFDSGNGENQRDPYGIGHYAVVGLKIQANSRLLLLLLLVLVETPNRSTVSRAVFLS